MVAALVTAAVLIPGSWAQAQTEDEDRYAEEDERDEDRFAVAVGIGLVEPSNEVETYYMASLRIQVSGRSDRRDRDDSGRGRDPRGEGISGFIEPEIGYWEQSEGRVSGSDLLIGVNLLGVVPFGQVDYFFGAGAGVHFIDAALAENDPLADGTDSKFGANAQFGLDLYITDNLSAFGAGRFDLVQEAEDDVQSKIYLGLRARF
jgi:hypothetical protein